MNYYDKTLRTIDEVKTITSHMVALGKIRTATEDEHLKYLIEGLVFALQYPHLHRVQKPVPTSLMFFPLQETQRLHQYCRTFFLSNRVEWQVLAERNGWIPPPRRF